MSDMFFYARVNAKDTTFLPEYERDDFNGVLSAEVVHAEGDFPILTVEVRNPYGGLLSSGSAFWLWMAWRNPDTNNVEPLFFGRLVGQPKKINAEVVELQYMARSVYWLVSLQALAEKLKADPSHYDPIFVRSSQTRFAGDGSGRLLGSFPLRPLTQRLAR